MHTRHKTNKNTMMRNTKQNETNNTKKKKGWNKENIDCE